MDTPPIYAQSLDAEGFEQALAALAERIHALALTVEAGGEAREIALAAADGSGFCEEAGRVRELLLEPNRPG